MATNKPRFLITVDQELKDKLSERADKENRSLNNLVVTILKEYVEGK